MPLVVNGKPATSRFISFEDFSKKHPHFKDIADAFCKKPIQTIGKGVLYVMQREYASVTPEDGNVTLMGSDDATTCHIVVLRNTASGVTSLGHFDGHDTSNGIKNMIESVTRGSRTGSGKIELNLFGGFLDDRRDSDKLTTSILEIIQNQQMPIHLTSACITGFNDIIDEGLHKPRVYGVGVTIQDGNIFPATFQHKGPDEYIRHARSFSGCRKMTEVYSSHYKEFRILPYEYVQDMTRHIPFFLAAPDEVILQNLSTSPHCEPPDFVANTKATLRHILSNPKPLKTVFPGGNCRVYKYQVGTDVWARV